MAYRYHKVRKDTNHREIVETLDVHGLSVLDISSVKNCCDIVVSNHKKTVLFEIKDGSKVPKSGTSWDIMTEGERKFAESWKGEYYVVTSADEILEIMAK